MSTHRDEWADRDVHISRMVATPGDAWLSVHAIAEYAFCPRAGLLAYENKRGDVDDEPPAFDTLPAFELAAIENEIARHRQRIFKWLWAIAIATLTGPVGAWFRQYWLLVLGFVVMAFISYQIISTLLQLLELYRRRGVALASRCAEPDPFCEFMQPVNWFGMFHLGFESQNLKEPLRHIKWQYEGRPWRILRKGSLSIPVFRARSAQSKPQDSHIVKIAAYCELVSFCFGHDCPYGIVLIGDDYSGFAVPNHPSFRKRFHDSLVELRHLAAAADQRAEGDVPNDERKCSGCPLGKPRLVSWGQQIHRFGAPVPINARPGRNDKPIHCDCGDRFEWEPPFVEEQNR